MLALYALVASGFESARMHFSGFDIMYNLAAAESRSKLGLC